MTTQQKPIYFHVFDASGPLREPTTKLYKPRKSHAKSRQGCKLCKVRRVKCDEKRPSCGACLKRHIACRYPSELGSPRLLWPDRKSPLVLSTGESAFSCDYDLEMLRYFGDVLGKMMWAPTVLPGVNEGVHELALKNQHIMHAMIASAVLHIQLTSPCTMYDSIQTKHWVSASSSFRKSIINQNWNHNADALLTTCMLLNLLSFADASANRIPTVERWPVVSQPAILRNGNHQDPSTKPLNWLNIQLGLSPLLSSLSRHAMETSIWLPIFLLSQPESTHIRTPPDSSLPNTPDPISLPSSETNPFHDDRPGTIGIPPSYISLFNIRPDSEGDRHPYLRPVRRIVSLLPLPPGNASSMLYLQFIQGVTPQYMRLLEARDPRALLIFAVWMGMLCSVDFWWSHGRAMAECRAAVAYLDGEGDGVWVGVGMGQKDEVDRRVIEIIRKEGWLEMPARACGWVLKHGMEQEEGVGMIEEEEVCCPRWVIAESVYRR